MLGLVRLKDELDEKTVEFAIVVRSRIKGHGLGWLLMQHVIDYAKKKGLRRVLGDVLVENATMLQMCAELGFRQMDMGSDLRRVVLDPLFPGSVSVILFPSPASRRRLHCESPLPSENTRTARTCGTSLWQVDQAADTSGGKSPVFVGSWRTRAMPDGAANSGACS